MMMFEMGSKNVNVGNEALPGNARNDPRWRSHKLEGWIGKRRDGGDGDVINHSNKGLQGEVRSILM